MKAILFGDELGLSIFEKTVIPRWDISAIVAAEGRPLAVEAAKHLSRRYDIHCLLQPCLKKRGGYQKLLEDLRGYKPEMFLVNSYSRLLPGPLLDIPTLGSFNIHTGVLPEYRGTNIINWVLINGEEYAGVTLHKMTEKVDTGPIMLARRIKINFEDTALTLRERLAALAVDLINEAVPLFEKGALRLYPQDEARARCWPKRKAEDGYFSWDWDEYRIYNMIRALVKPWPGAFTYEGGDRALYETLLPFKEVRRLKREKGSCRTPA